MFDPYHPFFVRAEKRFAPEALRRKLLTVRVGPVLWVSDATNPRPGNVVA
jgi:hypothetical protein